MQDVVAIVNYHRKNSHSTTRYVRLCGESDGITNAFAVDGSDSVTRVTMCGYSDSTRVTLRKMVIRIDSSHVFHRMTRLESQSMARDSSQSHILQSL